MKSFIQPNWPAPKNIAAYTSLRRGGVSLPPFDKFNLASHVGDNPEHVENNRKLLKKTLKLPAEPVWIKQTHSTIAVPACKENLNKEADATFTDEPNQVCIVLTADCLPILVCNKKGSHVAAIHAGWRGLANGVIEAALTKLNLPGEDLLVWLGPAIGPNHFEVKEDVRSIFMKEDPKASFAFTPSSKETFLGNLFLLAKMRLEKLGVRSIYSDQFCTYSDVSRFYSYRRDGDKTGRMASLIYINSKQ